MRVNEQVLIRQALQTLMMAIPLRFGANQAIFFGAVDVHVASRKFFNKKNITYIYFQNGRIKFGIRQLWNDPHERQCLEGVAGQETKSQLTSGSFKQATIIDLEILMRLAKSCYHTHL